MYFSTFVAFSVTLYYRANEFFKTSLAKTRKNKAVLNHETYVADALYSRNIVPGKILLDI